MRQVNRWMMGAVASIAVIAALALVLGDPISSRDKTAELRLEHLKVFSETVLVLESYQFTYYHCLPEAICRDCYGTRVYSWRAELLRFAESLQVPYEIYVPWYDPCNGAWAARQSRNFCFARSAIASSDSLQTHMWAITGPGTAFDGEHRTVIGMLPNDTILLIEVAQSLTLWPEPGDLDIENIPQGIAKGTDGTGVIVAFADGEAWFLDHTTPVEDLSKFFTIKGALAFDRDDVLATHRRMRYHY